MTMVAAAIAAIRAEIEKQTAPDKMSKKDALTVLEEIGADVVGMVDALPEEVGNE